MRDKDSTISLMNGQGSIVGDDGLYLSSELREREEVKEERSFVKHGLLCECVYIYIIYVFLHGLKNNRC